MDLKCGDIVQPAQDISGACARYDLYTYSWASKTIQNGLGKITFWVVLADASVVDDL